MATLEEDLTEIRIQTEEPTVVPFPRSIISRVRSSFICCNLLGALGVGMVSGVSAGCCMGAMGTAMTRIIRDAMINHTILTREIHFDEFELFKTPQDFICVGLLVATLSSVVGVIGGLQAYNLARKPDQEHASGKALALAAPVAVLGVAVTGASVGAVVVKYCFKYFGLAYVFEKILFWSLLCISCNFCCEAEKYLSLLICAFLFFIEFFGLWLFSLTESIIFADMMSMCPLIFLCFLVSVFDENATFKISVKVPAIVITTVLISRSFLRDEHQLVPLLDPAKATVSALLVLERFFIIVFSVQVCQASCGSVLYSYYVTGGEGMICASAVAAGGGVVTVLLTASPMLGIGASLGCLLAASGAAGVALSAAGDRGQRYGGYVGRAGAVVGAGVGAFLILVTQDVKYALMVALCAAAFPGAHFIVLFGLDPTYTFLAYLFSKKWCWLLCGLAGVVVVCILAYMSLYFTIVVFVLILIFCQPADQRR